MRPCSSNVSHAPTPGTFTREERHRRYHSWQVTRPSPIRHEGVRDRMECGRIAYAGPQRFVVQTQGLHLYGQVSGPVRLRTGFPSRARYSSVYSQVRAGLYPLPVSQGVARRFELGCFGSGFGPRLRDETTDRACGVPGDIVSQDTTDHGSAAGSFLDEKRRPSLSRVCRRLQPNSYGSPRMDELA